MRDMLTKLGYLRTNAQNKKIPAVFDNTPAYLQALAEIVSIAVAEAGSQGGRIKGEIEAEHLEKYRPLDSDLRDVAKQEGAQRPLRGSGGCQRRGSSNGSHITTEESSPL